MMMMQTELDDSEGYSDDNLTKCTTRGRNEDSDDIVRSRNATQISILFQLLVRRVFGSPGQWTH